MGYVTQQQYVDWFSESELIQHTDRDNTGAVNVTVFDEAVARASKRIDGYISPRYTLPLNQSLIDNSPIPDTCGIIVRYLLSKNCANEEIEKRYEDALKWLRDVAARRVSLGEEVADVTGMAIVAKTGKSSYNWGGY